MIGQQLGGRYEVLERVGGGGMAVVYKAHDTMLNRAVAVKVLRPQFVCDEEFIRRFRREAQSAASLSHPNVVSIYDVGQDKETHYIVMEYIEGHNLNELIKQDAPFQAEEAVRIATQICDALGHAHQNKIIHRDIKPHNILIGKNGRVKVTDFGIARAASASDITQTGAVIGSVHYFSPEHAKGVSQGEQSDLYSLGIVLYQMMTGKLPFLGESPISVALKHLQEPFEEPRIVNPMIPQSVENIILKSMRKNPQERYGNAEEMLKDLESCLNQDRLHEAKLMFRPIDEEVDEPTLVMPAIGKGREGSAHGEHSSARLDPVPLPGRTAARKSSKKVEDEQESKGNMASRQDLADINHMLWIRPVLFIAIFVVALAGMWWGAQAIFSRLAEPADVLVPDLAGKTVMEAQQQLTDLGLKSSVIREFNDEHEQDTVISHDPEGIKIKEGSTVELIVSQGPKLLRMENHVGQSFTDVEEALLDAGVSPEQIRKEEAFSDEQPSGSIIEQKPEPGTEYNPNTEEIVLVVSKGKELIETPDLLNKKKDVAVSILTRNGLKASIRMNPSYKVPKDYVYHQFPYEPGDPVAPGSEIALFVSSGYPEEALQPVKPLEIAPRTEGQVSTVKIWISDARGNNRLWGTQEISRKTTIPVSVIVSPEKSSAVIRYELDGRPVDSLTVTYKDAQDQNAPRPEPLTAPNPNESGVSEGDAG